ncbi:TRAP transporter small permease [Herbaspirillum chlorophenolicum]|jgi:TRAP-type C4-dicarboxylate transport system permease small subunit|uniref:TRAP transporter small permease n=1 Tax=Herbaspirillum chlorophenolicum TaxID=211589 RepID=UPI00067DE792|nr:TRAP transporter small permease [Herbaspirillum chlorophenolicum]
MSELSVNADSPPEKEIRFSDLSLEEIVAGIGLIIIVLSVTWGVVTRYLLAQPAAWSGEVAGIAFAWTVFVGAAAVFKRGEHISIDLAIEYLPAAPRRLLQLLVDIFVFLTLAAVAGLALKFSIATIDAPTTILRIPQSVTYSGAAVGFMLMTIRHTMFAVRRLRQPGEPK